MKDLLFSITTPLAMSINLVIVHYWYYFGVCYVCIYDT